MRGVRIHQPSGLTEFYAVNDKRPGLYYRRFGDAHWRLVADHEDFRAHTVALLVSKLRRLGYVSGDTFEWITPFRWEGD